MTATPDRPATTPEGAGRRLPPRGAGYKPLPSGVPNPQPPRGGGGASRAEDAYPSRLRRLSERTEGAGEVALSEEEKALIYAEVPCNDWDAEADVFAAVERILADRENAVLRRAADRIEAELICCPTDDPNKVEPKHHICRWGIAARNLVLERITR